MPTKKKSSALVRLSQYNRLQAIVRSPQYLRDYQYIKQLEKGLKKIIPLENILTKYGVKVGDKIPVAKLNKEERECINYYSEKCRITDKWKLTHPWNPQEIEQIPKGILHGFVHPDIVGVIPHKIGKIKKGVVRYPEDFIPYLKDRRYLTLEIDLTAREGEILERVKGKINFFGKLVKKPRDRDRKTTYDPWKVYDLHNEGRTYEKIVMEIDPTQDGTLLLARIDAVRSAYRKACRMIRAVTLIGV